MVAYATGSSVSVQQSARSQLSNTFVTQFSSFVQDSTGMGSGALRSAIVAQVQATVTVIDDQRLNSLPKLGADDRSAAASTEVLGDLIVAAVVAKLQSRFSA
jgi:hypothetical protein